MFDFISRLMKRRQVRQLTSYLLSTKPPRVTITELISGFGALLEFGTVLREFKPEYGKIRGEFSYGALELIWRLSEYRPLLEKGKPIPNEFLPDIPRELTLNKWLVDGNFRLDVTSYVETVLTELKRLEPIETSARLCRADSMVYYDRKTLPLFRDATRFLTLLLTVEEELNAHE